jgi:hypothetical protein
VPQVAIVAMLVFTTLGLVVMLPYFAYVFRFLEPSSIVARIREQAVDTVEAAVTTHDAARAVASQGEVLAAMEELTDITSNSISGKDKIIASRAVDALKDFVVGYLTHKTSAPTAWFAIGPAIRDNPDFVAMDPESLRDLEARRTWVEWKALRQYLGIYNEAQGAMPDINYLVAIDTRYVGEAAAAKGDREVVRLVFRFMNSYLRATINAKAVRTAYNVLNQYRLLVEAMIKRGEDEIALEAVGHMIYYGRTSYDLQLGFITETVAYDVGALCELAHSHRGGDGAARAVPRARSAAARQAPGGRPGRHPQGPGEAGVLLPGGRGRRAGPPHRRRHARRAARAAAGDPRAARAGRVEGLLGDHRSRPQLRVHAGRPAPADVDILWLSR